VYSERADPVFRVESHIFGVGHTFAETHELSSIWLELPNSGTLEQLEKNKPSSAIDGRPLNIPYTNVPIQLLLLMKSTYQPGWPSLTMGKLCFRQKAERAHRINSGVGSIIRCVSALCQDRTFGMSGAPKSGLLYLIDE
jgi:hypothetical protein